MRRQPERLAGVDREVGVLAAQVLERVEVPGGREAGLGPGDVEPDDAARRGSATASSAISRRAGGVAHRGEQGADPDRACRRRPRSASPSRKPASTASTTSGSDSPPSMCSSGAKRDLGVDDPVGGQVERALPGHPGQLLGGLHDRDGVRERLEVALERARVGGVAEPGAQLHRHPSSAGRRSRMPRRARRPWRAAARRPGGRAAAPWALGRRSWGAGLRWARARSTP